MIKKRGRGFSGAIFGILCLVSSSLVAIADELHQADIPTAEGVLAEAVECAKQMGKGLSPAYALRRLAAVQAVCGHIDEAFRTLNAIELTGPPDAQTADNLRRVGFMEMQEALARDGQVAIALHVVETATDQYAGRRDEALGTIAVVQAQNGDAEGAKSTLEKMKDPRRPYDYAMQVAINLNDKALGQRLIQVDLEAMQDSASTIQLFSNQQLRPILYMLSLLVWCDEREAAKRLLETISQANKLSDDFRQKAERLIDEGIADLRNCRGARATPKKISQL